MEILAATFISVFGRAIRAGILRTGAHYSWRHIRMVLLGAASGYATVVPRADTGVSSSSEEARHGLPNLERAMSETCDACRHFKE